jgi:alginate O-acetyltransferase complex protein AlgI
MLFCSLQFLGFFLLVLLAYWSTPWRQGRVWLLLIASFYFYATWNIWLAALVLGAATYNYLLALWMGSVTSAWGRRALLTFGLTQNVALLVHFKYVNFFLESLQSLLTSLGFSGNLGTLNIIVPIGISFYTFEAINYLMDVYWKKTPPEKNLANFLLFITFFPHLVAGPIVRAKDFLPQIHRRKRWSWERCHLGLRLILLGLFKKLAIADQMALFADPVFAAPGSYGAGVLWLAALAYLLQVYGDFSGYSDIAIGTAHLLGYKLTQNFNMPYLALNIADFWRRWHMSLSSWLRDYLFVPLGGSRGGRWLTYRNLLITMTVCGLWHGASWMFVLFGLVHGLSLIVHHAFRGWCKEHANVRTTLETPPGVMLRWMLTMGFFMLSLVLFRSQSLVQAGTYLERMFSAAEGQAPPRAALVVLLAAGVMAAGHWLGQRDRWLAWYERLPAPVRGMGYACMTVATILLMPTTTQTFIYFQF